MLFIASNLNMYVVMLFIASNPNLYFEYEYKLTMVICHF